MFCVIVAEMRYSILSHQGSNFLGGSLPMGLRKRGTSSASLFHRLQHLLKVCLDLIAVFHLHDIGQDILGLDGAHGPQFLLDPGALMESSLMPMPIKRTAA